jgi:O-methyltransferase
MLRERIKRLVAPVRYRNPAPELSIDRLYLYLDALWHTRALPGAAVEIGCFQCGTSAWAYRFLAAIDCPREYVCVDTFNGFPRDQFENDVRLGTRAMHRGGFSANSRALVQQMLDRWGASAIRLVEADIVASPAAVLPPRIAVALVDVDLEAPTFAALEKIYARLSPGGIILVDDCAENDDFRGARVAYQRFAAACGVPARYAFGMGCIGDITPAARPR